MMTQDLRNQGFVHAVNQSPMDKSRVVFVPIENSMGLIEDAMNQGVYEGGEGVYMSEGERFPPTKVLAWKYDE
jgi:predicted component of viral defense system (DUF524 family)